MATATATKPTTARTTAPRSKGLPALVTPYNTSEFHAMVDAARAHFNAVHDQLSVVAVELRRELRKVKGSPALLGLDTTVAARRVARHIVQAAGYEQAAARAIVRSFTQYQELFLNKPSAHRRGFDINK